MATQSLQADETQIEEREFYATHSVYSNPGKYAHLLENLPHDFAGISRVVQGLIYHFMAGQYIYGYCPPKERLVEIDTRFMVRMLGCLIDLDSRPLTESRDFDKRLVGCCRDFSLLTCAILRQHNIPARLRYGFASYFVPGYWIDHVIVEVWNGMCWQRFDSQVTDGSDKLDLSESDFVTGGRAWQLYRHEGADPARFGLGPGTPELSGVWFIRGRLLLDVAALNKQEMLCWDQWGLGYSRENHLSAEEETVLDRAAVLGVQSDVVLLHALSMANVGLRVPETVTCFSPAVGQHQVAI